MNEYTIYCTPEQTRKSLVLGAPIVYSNTFTQHAIVEPLIYKGYAVIPTTEQMMGWLRTKGFRFKIIEYDKETYWQIHYDDTNWLNHGETIKYEEATLASIDAALEYLSNK